MAETSLIPTVIKVTSAPGATPEGTDMVDKVAACLGFHMSGS